MTTKETSEKDNPKVLFLSALNKVQGLIEPIKVDSENPHFKNRYASLAAVNNAVMGILSENGFVLLQGGVEISGKPYLRTSLYHVAGHSVSFEYPLTVSDNPQHVSSSCTYARRVSICALLALSTEDDDAETAVAPTRSASTMKREGAQDAPAPSDFKVATFIPGDVDIKEGDGPKGHYTKYSVQYDGKWMATFDATAGKMLISAFDRKVPVRVAYKQNGKYLNIGKVYLDDVEPETQDVPF